MAFCSKCGTELIESQLFCSKCGEKVSGAGLKNALPNEMKNESGSLVFVLGLFFGCFGIHQFVSGNTKKGLVYLLCSTIGAILIIPPFVIFVLVLIDLYKISKSDFYNVDKSVRYIGSTWMTVLAILWIILIPLLMVFGVIAAVSIPKVFGMSDKAKASEIQPAAGTYIKLLQAYAMETSKLGSWEEIGYRAPGARSISSIGETPYFTYADLNPGFIATNKIDMNGCPKGSKWTVIPELITADGSYSDVKLNMILPEDSACESLTPSFLDLK